MASKQPVSFFDAASGAARTSPNHILPMDLEREHRDKSCPICLEEHDGADGGDPDRRLLVPPCRHAACRSCLERMLHVEGLGQGRQDTRNADRSTHVSTLGSCPLCRSPVYLFDLVDLESNETVYRKLPAIPLPQGLRDAVFSEPRYGVGYGSWHFMSGTEENGTESSGDRLYFDLSKIKGLTEDTPRQISLREAHFHDASNTLSGHLHFSSGQYSHWNVYLNFSRDFSCIRSGLVHKVRRSIDDPTVVREKYPLDGTWDDIVDQNSSLTCQVEGMVVAALGPLREPFVLRVKRQEKTIEMCDVAGDVVAVASFDWTSRPLGPDVGERLEWRLGDERESRRVWMRKTASTTVPPDEFMFIGGTSERLYRRECLGPRQPPKYNRETLWGNVFCQALKVGFASYHFISPEDGAYISYENRSTALWPPLDNGAPVPSRVQFHNIRVQGASFQGDILWEADYGTSWQAMTEWNYCIQFDSAFTCIVSGHVDSRGPNNGGSRRMSSYGIELNYVNAALFSVFNDVDPVAANESLDTLIDRLVKEGASGHTIANVRLALTPGRLSGENPIDFNL